MSELFDLNKNIKIKLKPLRYEQKDEFWFSCELVFSDIKKSFIKLEVPFHLNDLIELIEGIRTLIKYKKNIFFIYEPIEPYLKIIIKFYKNKYYIESYFCKGPVFEPFDYEEIKMITNEANLSNFINLLEIEIKKIDINLEMKKVKL